LTVVLDAGGQLKAVKREDGSSLLRSEIAGGKAWRVLGLDFGGRELARRAAADPMSIQALSVASGGKIVPVPGGVLIRDVTGEVVGAVGVSGTPLRTKHARSMASLARVSSPIPANPTSLAAQPAG
jgi:uncharacterized protein GlcG (DUF336 family)